MRKNNTVIKRRKIQYIILLFIFSINICFGQETSSLEKTALLLKDAISNYEMIKKENDSSQLSAAALDIAAIYSHEGLLGKALEYYRVALNYSEKEGGLNSEIKTKMAEAFLLENELDSVIFYKKELLEFYKKNKKYEEQIKILQSLVRVYENKPNSIQDENEDLKKALNLNFEILELSENQRDSKDFAIALNNIGCNYNLLQDYSTAIKYLKDAEDLNEEKNVLDAVILYTNLGVASLNIGNREAAFRYFELAKAAAKKSKTSTGELNHLTALAYLQEKDWYNAEQYNNDAIRIGEKSQDLGLLGKCYDTAAEISKGLYEYENALAFTQKSLEVESKQRTKAEQAEQRLSSLKFSLEKAEKDIRLALINEEVNRLAMNRLELEKNNLELEKDKYALEAAKQEGELALLKQEQETREANLKNQELAALQVQQQLKLTRQQLEAEQKDRSIAELKQKEELQKMELSQNAALEKERLQEIELLNQQKAIADLELDKQATFRQGVYLVGTLGALFLALMIGSYILARRANKRLAEQKRVIEKSQAETEAERAKSEALLLNILPIETAKELRETGFATPKKYKQVSVLFTDFRNFTSFAEHLSVDELIKELNACFFAFDEIIERHNLEKIKTIGDAYMCAGGIPKANDTNAHDAVNAAIEMQEFLEKHSGERKRKGLPYLEMRLGIHTGQVVAGVVGKNKFAYDIWGDTVNLASRMESSGEVGKVNISEATYELIKNDFDCVFRGAIEAKNKGEIGMYFVESE